MACTIPVFFSHSLTTINDQYVILGKRRKNTEEYKNYYAKLQKKITDKGLNMREQRTIYVPEKIYLRLDTFHYKYIEIFNIRGKLFPHMKLKEELLQLTTPEKTINRLIINPSGLHDLFSSHEAHAFFGTKSPAVSFAQQFEDVYLNKDGVDYYMNLKTTQTLQYFYISFDKSKSLF